MAEAELVLGDLRVLELGEDVAGAFCTKLLAALGAEVIKVERPGVGDSTRTLGPFLRDEPHPETSALFLYLNTGKKSITLDIESTAGVAILRRLVQACDIVVESFPPGYLASLGLGYTDLEPTCPRLIYTSITPFGQTGPYHDYKGEDIVAQALGGLMYTIGTPDREPLKIGGRTALYTTGISAFSATMLALHVRDLEGHGQHVDVSAMETMAVAQIHSSIHYQFRGENPTRRESTLIPARDGWVTPGLEIGTQDDTWRRVCELIGRPELAEDERFVTRQARREHRQELLEVLKEWTAQQPKEVVYHELQKLRTIAGYVAGIDDLLRSPQLLARGFFQPLDHPVAGELPYPGLPFRMEGQTWQHRRAPLLGEHNLEVYCDRLGYRPEEVDRLREMGTI